MSYSYYKFTNAQRAFSGLGFPYGADEDAAFIISWLEAFELSGIHLLANILNKIDNNFDGTLTNKDFVNEISLEKKSCLMIGPGFVDFVNFQTLKNNSSVRNSTMYRSSFSYSTSTEVCKKIFIQK